MRKKLKRKKGLTLLELVIVLGLMSIVTSLVFGFVNITQRKSKELDIRQNLQHDGTMITESMMKNVLESKGMYALEFTTGQIPNKVTGLVFGFDGNGEVVGTEYKDAVMYYAEGTNLKIKEHYYGNTLVADKEIIECLKAYVGGSIPECGHWKNERVISENLKSLNVENEKLKLILNPILSVGGTIGTSDINLLFKAISKEKSINLKVSLEAPYYNESISHDHTIEISFRNAK